MVTEAPQMNPAHREAALGAQIAQLQIRNAWLERQVQLEAARVSPNYVEKEYEGRTVDQLSALGSLDLAIMFERVASCMQSASVTEERPFASSIPIHNLEWNGELPHPTWTEVVKIGYLSINDKDAKRVNKEADPQGFHKWTMMSALRHDGGTDDFSVRNISLPRFRDDRSAIYAGVPDRYGRLDKHTPIADNRGVAEFFDFTRGVRGGLKVVGRKAVFRPFSDD